MNFKDIHIRDPFILLDNDKYYMYGSRGPEAWGECTGLDVYVSNDLVEWSAPIEVFTRTEGFWSDKNYWAPEVHKYQGSYYMFVSFKSDTKCRGTQILKSDSPTGPFLEYSDGPVTPSDWECLDGTLYIENGKPYMVFCHEWLQVGDGEMCAIELSSDLKQAVGEPVLLFTATDFPKSKCVGSENDFVTDGPFLYKTKEGRLIMIWSTHAEEGYCEIISYSKDGTLISEWTHDDRLLFEKDGGHGMIFRDKENKIQFVAHTPNNTPMERPKLFELCERYNTLYIKD